VADRWHLLKNLREAVERLLGRLATSVQAALRESAPAADPSATGGAAAAAAAYAVTIPATAALAAERAVGAADPRLSPEPARANDVAAAAATPGPTPIASPAANALTAPRPSPSPRERTRQARRLQRAEQYQRVHEMRGQGRSLRQIARTAGLSVKRVLCYTIADGEAV
jgi:hypothetical protein